MCKPIIKSKTIWVNAVFIALALFFPDMSYNLPWWPVITEGVKNTIIVICLGNLGLRCITKTKLKLK